MEKKRILFLLLCAVLGLAAGAVSLLPVDLLPALLFPVLMFVAGSIMGFPGASIATLSCFLVLAILFGEAALPDAIYGGVMAYGGAVVMSFSRRSFEALVGSCGIVLLGVWSNILVAAQMNGPQVIENLFVADETIVALMRQSYALMGHTEQEVATLIGEFISLYGEMVPAALLGFAMLAGLASFLSVCALTRGRRRFLVPPFALWAMPRGSMLGAALMLIFGFVGSSQNWPGFSSVLLAAQTYIMITYSIQGLAVLWFMLGKTKLPLGAKLPLAAIAAIFVGTGLLFIAVLDYMMGFRRRIPPNEAGPSGPPSV